MGGDDVEDGHIEIFPPADITRVGSAEGDDEAPIFEKKGRGRELLGVLAVKARGEIIHPDFPISTAGDEALPKGIGLHLGAGRAGKKVFDDFLVGQRGEGEILGFLAEPRPVFLPLQIRKQGEEDAVDLAKGEFGEREFSELL